MTILLDKETINNKNYSNECIAVYVILCSINKKDKKNFYVSSKSIACELFNKIKISQRKLNRLKVGLNNFIDNKFVDVLDNNEKSNEYILDLSKIWVEADTKTVEKTNKYFIFVNNEDVHKIMNYNYKYIDNYKLFRYYLNILGSINNNTKFGYKTLEDLAVMSNITQDTADEYNKILEKLELLAIHRKQQLKSDGKIIGLRNTYGRYEYKEIVLKAGESYYNNFKKAIAIDNDEYIEIDINKSKYNKSMSAKYATLVRWIKEGKEVTYSIEMIEEIYNYCVNYNKIKEIESKNSGFKADNLKDLSIFDKYNFNKKDANDNIVDEDNITLLSDDDIWGSDDTMDNNDNVDSISATNTIADIGNDDFDDCIRNTDNEVKFAYKPLKNKSHNNKTIEYDLFNDEDDIQEYFLGLYNKLHSIVPSIKLSAQLELKQLDEWTRAEFEDFEEKIA